MSKIECIQYNTVLSITGAINGTSQIKLSNGLGLKSLKFGKDLENCVYFINLSWYKVGLPNMNY